MEFQYQRMPWPSFINPLLNHHNCFESSQQDLVYLKDIENTLWVIPYFATIRLW